MTDGTPPARELRSLPGSMLRNYVSRYEEGGVQPHPRLSFVDAEGRACIVGALAGARSLREFAATEVCRSFPRGPLERLSRLFEDGRVTPGEVYRDCLLELARRRAVEVRRTDGRRERGRHSPPLASLPPSPGVQPPLYAGGRSRSRER